MMVELEATLRAALSEATQEVEGFDMGSLSDNTNIFEAVDSFCVVDILLGSESLLESQLGRYVPLAGETIFDAEKSPLRRWDRWVSYVESCIGK
jgi:hypothetical protein